MKQQRTDTHRLGTLAVLTVFCVFAISILTVILFGAKTYQKLNDESEGNYRTRTLALYLSGKVRQAALPGEITVTEFGDGDCVAIPEEIDGATYYTWLYCDDGWLMELFGDADNEYWPEDGERILRADGFTAALREGRLTLTAETEAGEPVELRFALRGGKPHEG